MRCSHCPRTPDRPCLGERLSHLCARPEYRDYLAGHDPENPRAVPPPPRPSDADARLAMAAELCVSGSGSCGCGAVPRQCGRPDRPADVFRARDCLPCQAAGWWEAGVEAGW